MTFVEVFLLKRIKLSDSPTLGRYPFYSNLIGAVCILLGLGLLTILAEIGASIGTDGGYNPVVVFIVVAGVMSPLIGVVFFVISKIVVFRYMEIGSVFKAVVYGVISSIILLTIAYFSIMGSSVLLEAFGLLPIIE